MFTEYLPLNSHIWLENPSSVYDFRDFYSGPQKMLVDLNKLVKAIEVGVLLEPGFIRCQELFEKAVHFSQMNANLPVKSLKFLALLANMRGYAKLEDELRFNVRNIFA